MILLLPFQGVTVLPFLPRVPLRLPWAVELLGFQPVISLPCVLSGRAESYSLARPALDFVACAA